MAWELCTFAQLKALLDLEQSLITDYPALGVIKPSVEFAIENYLGRLLESKERTATFYVTGPTNMINLQGLPVASVSSLSVTIAGESASYDYIVTEYGLMLYSDVRNALIEVTYTGGLATVPDNINRAALYQTAFEFQSKDQIGAENVSTEGGAVSRPELGLLRETKRLIVRDMHPMKITG